MAPSISESLRVLFGPVFFSKLYAPIALLIVGLGAWFFLRELGFARLACLLGGVAASLNCDFFATACWGVASQPICFGLGYIALGLVANLRSCPWARIPLAGMAVGMGVIEAADIGAIFSVFVGVWVAVHALVEDGNLLRRIGMSILRLGVVVVFAVFIAISAVSALVGVAVKGVVGTAQDETTKAMRWHEATQWSLPKREVLDLIIPGFFGFRMDTPYQLPSWLQKPMDGGAYWGFSGRDANWDRFFESDRKGDLPGGFFRYGMGGGYLGMVVLLAGFWALVQSFRGEKSFFSPAQRKILWFWLGVLIVSAALMFGRFAPFYQFFYALPYASTIRNPAKFLHVFTWAFIIVAGYGLHGLTTLYLERATATTKGIFNHFGTWWRKETGFDKKWVITMFSLLALAVVAWGLYVGNRHRVETYIGELNYFGMLQQSGRADPASAAAAAAKTFDFTIRQVRWAIAFLALTVGMFALLISGAFAGKRARVAGYILMGLIVVDLGWQAQPWVIAQNWKDRYVEAGNNAVIDFLRAEPYKHRVSRIPDRTLQAFRLDSRLNEIESMFQSVYNSEWMQHIFPYYNIQSLNVVQMPRRPVEYDAFELATQFFSNETLYRVTRRLELTSTDYILAAAPMVSVLNQAYDPEQQRFKPILFFEFYQTRSGGPILARTNQTGPFAVIKFTGALPRASLYTDWQTPTYTTNTAQWRESFQEMFPPDYPIIFNSVATNDLAALELMTRKSFDPAQTVLLAESLPVAPSGNAAPGTVEYVSYAPKKIVLKANATAASVLLLNDKYDSGWSVTVNGKPAELLRCNYLMRGVFLPEAGEHTVEFTFSRPMGPTYITLSAIVIGLGLCMWLVIASRREKNTETKRES